MLIIILHTLLLIGPPVFLLFINIWTGKRLSIFYVATFGISYYVTVALGLFVNPLYGLVLLPITLLALESRGEYIGSTFLQKINVAYLFVLSFIALMIALGAMGYYVAYSCLEGGGECDSVMIGRLFSMIVFGLSSIGTPILWNLIRVEELAVKNSLKKTLLGEALLIFMFYLVFFGFNTEKSIFSEVFEIVKIYKFKQSAAFLYPEYLPERFEKGHERKPDQTLISHFDCRGNRACWLEILQSKTSDKPAAIFFANMENMLVSLENIAINNFPGFYSERVYQFRRGYKPESTVGHQTIIWSTSEINIRIQCDGSCTKDELLRIAESMQPIK